MNDQEIRSLWQQTHDRIIELLLLTSALQTLLQQAGVFSKADVEARVEELRIVLTAHLQLHLEEWQEKDTHEQLRRLFESYEGAKQ